MSDLKIHDAIRLTVETAFYQNSVRTVSSRFEAYQCAYQANDTIISDLEVFNPQGLGLPDDAKVLVQNNGSIVGRTAKARQIVDKNNGASLLRVLQDVIDHNGQKAFIRVDAHVGLDPSFSVNASLMIPKTSSMNAYNFALNFEFGTVASQVESVFLYVDPDWTSPDYPDGLVILDPVSHVGVVLGLKYFGEIKKAVLSLVWNQAHQSGYTACHGGLKVLNGTVLAAFGLSGSGKSTLTLYNHSSTDEVSVLHDDAFIIRDDLRKIIALEPAYFDKTADPDMDMRYVLTAQNNAVTLKDNKRIILTGDRRNPNGRCIKSQFATANRVNVVNQPLDALLWIMKDDALPPLVRVHGSVLAATLGATLTTTRSSAENSQELGKTVIEPYANPFRIYPLHEDYEKFKRLFDSCACYIVNTGTFNGKKIPPSVSIALLEGIASSSLAFKPLSLEGSLEFACIEGFNPDVSDETMIQKLKASFDKRIDFLGEFGENNRLNSEMVDALSQLF